MRIGSGQVSLSLPESFSLKDKRRIMNSIKQRLRNRFNLSVIELNPDVPGTKALSALPVLVKMK
jgi:uncharacterized protein YlxP (DUF503 family)